jgi:anti-sigma factor RsiW
MTCQECSDRLSALLDDELTPEEIGAIRAHLLDCDACCRELALLACLDAEAARMSEPQPSDALWEKIENRLDEVLPGSPETNPWRSSPEEENVVDFFRAKSRLSKMGRM